MNRQSYTSDISREQFENIRIELEGARKATRPRMVDLYDVFCAVLYVLSNGCKWRNLPHDFPKWENVYRYFQMWKESNEHGESLLDSLLKKCDIPSEKSGSKSQNYLPHR
jgi:transposase